MFKEDDGEDLREELGLTDKRSDELVNIVQTMMDQEAPDGGYGRTSHILLNIAGRKDLTEVERVACTFLFCCKILIGKSKIRSSRPSVSTHREGEREEERERPRVISGMLPGIPFGMSNMKEEEFIDIERGIAGMIVSPEGVDKSELINVLMTSIISMLRCMPKKDAQDFCKNASIAFARMAISGDIKL